MIWCYFSTIFLGFWLLAIPAAFGYTDPFLLSDRITGVIFVICGFLSLSSKRKFSPWIIAFGGVWLQMAPLIFWAKDPVIYLNDTIIGVLAILFSLVIPGIPGVVDEIGHEIPPGWKYNPSAWIQRIPIIALACVGWFISRYLAAYQLGYIDSVWDPVFGEGTKLVITSKLSKSFPISDAGLGAVAYTLEAILGCKGGPARWRTMPWMCALFALLVVPLGIVSILLVISQPLIVGAWCFLCLVTAFSMLIMVVLTIDEMMAVIQFLREAVKEGKPFWRTFWKGGDLKHTKDDDKTPPFTASPIALIKTWRWGVSFHWTLLIAAVVGLLTMAAPTDIDHLIGALIVVVSVISCADLARMVKYLLIPLGIVLVIFFTPIHLITAIFLVILALK